MMSVYEYALDVNKTPEEILKLPFDTRLIPYSMIRLNRKGK